MSDEFIALATKEVNEEISGIETLLSSCNSDNDIILKSSKLEKHTHKIKGLAPMMGKEELGELSSNLDTLLKEIIDGKKTESIFEIFVESLSQMKSSMTEPNYDLNPIIGKTKQALSNL